VNRNFPRLATTRRATSLAALLALAVLPLRQAAAQEGLNAASALEMRAKYLADLDTVHVKVLALANAIPADKYSWRPGEGVRSVSETFMHIATEWYLYVPMLIGAKPYAEMGAPRELGTKLNAITNKAEVIDYLNKSWAYGKAQVESVDAAKLAGKMKLFGREVTFPEMTFGMAGDLHEHLGQLIAYARMNKVVPPWSK
jgi:uncharacterized damage-inducible protein DinB